MGMKELLHKRILIAEKEKGFYSTGKTVKEIKILEISPSGEWVKIQNDNGNKYWMHYSDIIPIEVLKNDKTNHNKD